MSELYHNTGWMTDVLYVLKLTSNLYLFSVNAATLKGHVILFGHKYCMLHQRQENETAWHGSHMGKLYMLNCELLNSPPDKATVAGEMEDSSKIDLWHQRLAHVIVKYVITTVGEELGRS